MTEMTVNSKILTKIIEIVAKKALRKKLGKEATIDISKIKVEMNDGKTTIHFDGAVTTNTKDILELIKKS